MHVVVYLELTNTDLEVKMSPTDSYLSKEACKLYSHYELVHTTNIYSTGPILLVQNMQYYTMTLPVLKTFYFNPSIPTGEALDLRAVRLGGLFT